MDHQVQLSSSDCFPSTQSALTSRSAPVSAFFHSHSLPFRRSSLFCTSSLRTLPNPNVLDALGAGWCPWPWSCLAAKGFVPRREHFWSVGGRINPKCGEEQSHFSWIFTHRLIHLTSSHSPYFQLEQPPPTAESKSPCKDEGKSHQEYKCPGFFIGKKGICSHTESLHLV